MVLDQGFRMYHLMTQRKNFYGTLLMMKMLIRKLRAEIKVKTPKESEDDDNNEEDQGLRISEEERMHEEDEADELYCDVDINQGRGLQVSQETEDSHEEESFDLILRTPEDNEDDDNNEKDQGLRIADLLEMELKMILIDKMEGNKSIQ
nr:hypothetical protein [Tanacetum cinerariifolium]